MDVKIAARHGELTDDVRDYVEQKCERLAEDFDLLTRVEVTVTFEKNRNVVEFIGHCHKHDPKVASATGKDLYGSIDQAWDKLMGQLRKQKGKVKDHRKK